MAKKHAAAQIMKPLEDDAADRHIWEISLDQIRPAPWNPPARMDPKTVGELADSISVHGQQIPALLRPLEFPLVVMKDGKPCEPIRYEIVFGHRRYAALQLLQDADNEGNPEVNVAYDRIKAFVRKLTEEQAMILSGIENLQRQGFTDIEEAEFFRAAGERYGESAVKMLAEKLSVSERYIRKRIEILRLPESALKLWREGTWHVGHMEQLLRIGTPGEVEAWIIDYQKNAGNWNRLEDMAVYRLKETIEQRATGLSHGRFDKSECKVCPKNTKVQLTLWGFEQDKGAACLDYKCFKKKQQTWFDENWKTCKANKWGTNKAVVDGNQSASSHQAFAIPGYSYPAHTEKCELCPSFTTFLNIKGEPSQYGGYLRACTGDSACYSSVTERQKKNKASGNGDGKSEPEGARVAWHGEYYRQEFYAQEVPKLLDGLLTEDSRRLQLALACFVFEERAQIAEWFFSRIGMEAPKKADDYGYRYSLQQFIDAVRALKPFQIEILLSEACFQAAFHRHGNYSDSYRDDDRSAIAEFLQVDFTQYEVTLEYLQKKTKGELVRFIAFESGLLQEEDFRIYAGKTIGYHYYEENKGRISAEKLAGVKKPTLIQLITECGVELKGRLPKEIADRPKLGGKDA